MARGEWTLRLISESLKLMATEYPDLPPVPWMAKWSPIDRVWNGVDMAEFKFGTLTLRCAPTRGSVLRMAEKFTRNIDREQRVAGGRHCDLLPKPSMRRPPNADALLAELEDKT